MRVAFLLLFISIGFKDFSQSRTRIDQTNYWFMYESDEERCRNLSTNELINGALYLESLNGNPEIEFNFKDGLRHGVQLTWFKNGQLKSEYHYLNGIEHGKRSGWHANGNPHFVEYFINDLPHGTFKQWHKNGQLILEQFYEDGKQQGVQKMWYDINGQLSNESHYERGELDGIIKSWNPKGRLIYESEYKRGVFLRENCWDDLGEKINCD